MVIVDTKIVAGAPARLLRRVSAMRWQPGLKRVLALVGRDHHGGRQVHPGGAGTGRTCYNTLLEEGEKAMLAAEQHV